MILEDGRLYTAEQLCEAGVLGPDVSPEALKRATRRKENPFPCTRWPPGAKRGRIRFSKANVEAGIALGLQDETTRPADPPRQGSRRRPLAPVADLPPTSQRLTAKPESARRRTRKAS